MGGDEMFRIATKQLASEFSVRGIPTLMVFKSGDPVDRTMGLLGKDRLASALEVHI